MSHVVFWIVTYKVDKKAFWFLLVVLLYTFMEFKHGFIRADGHMVGFYRNTLLILGITALILPWGKYIQKIKQKIQLNSNATAKKIRTILSIFILVAIITASIFCAVLPLQSNPEEYPIINIKSPSDKFTSVLNQVNIIRTPVANVDSDVLSKDLITEIGDSSVTVMPWEIDYIVYNDLTAQYVPLPSIQTYQAYSYYLEKQYEEFFKSSRSPEYIIADFNAIDGGNLILETPGAWNVISQKYTLVLTSGKTSLLKKTSPDMAGEAEQNIIFEQVVDNSEAIEFPETDGNSIFSVEMELTPLGKIMKLLYRIPPIYMKFTFDDDSEMVYRVVPELLETGVSTYLPESIDELNSLMRDGKLNKKISKIQFVDKNRGILEYYLNGLCYYGDMHVVYSTTTSN